MMRKIVGVIGSGMIGRDPWAHDSWSGASRNLFMACKEAGFLHRAIGVEVPDHIRLPLIIRNFSFSRRSWVSRFRMDTRYYDELTRSIKKSLLADDFDNDFLQIGGIYDLPGIIQKRCKCYSYHDGNVFELAKSPYAPPIPKKLIQKAIEFEKRIYHKMDKIFTMSEYLRRSFIDDFGIDEEKVVNVGVGMNVDLPTPLRKDYSLKNIIFVGVDFYRKGGNLLLGAFRKVREVHSDASLHIIGPKKRPDILKKCTPGIIYHGNLSRNDRYQAKLFHGLMRNGTLFALPSYYEPFGIAVLEAMAYQMPCVTTNRWAFPELVTPGINGELVDCDDEMALAEKIINLLSNPDTLATQGMAARDLVLSKYTWQRVVSHIMREIAQL